MHLSISNLSTEIWPSGHFSISLKKQVKKSAIDNKFSRYKEETLNPLEVDDSEGTADNSLKANLTTSLPQQPKNESTSTELVQTTSPSLDLSAELSQNGPKPYGEGGLNKRSKKRIESAACCLEYKYSHRRLGFGTLTLPELTADRMAWLSGEINILAKRFFEWFKRETERIGSPSENVFVVELHPQRSIRENQFIPHIHFVYVARSAQQVYRKKGNLFYISADKFRKAWRNIIKNSLARYKEKFKDYSLVHWPQGREVDVQIIRKSAAGYLSKYLSKGGKFLEKLKVNVRKKQNTKVPFKLPRQWWGYSKGMKKQVDESIKPLPEKYVKLARSKLDGRYENEPILYIFRPTYYNIYLGKEIPLATCGKMKRSIAKRICFGNSS